jgi:hypothetical protein
VFLTIIHIVWTKSFLAMTFKMLKKVFTCVTKHSHSSWSTIYSITV